MVCKLGAHIFYLRALRGLPFLVYALSNIHELFFMIVVLLYGLHNKT